MKKIRSIFLQIFILITLILITCKPESVKQPAVGELAPDFTLKNQDQMNIKLSDFRGKKNIIIVFYPLDFTPV